VTAAALPLALRTTLAAGVAVPLVAHRASGAWVLATTLDSQGAATLIVSALSQRHTLTTLIRSAVETAVAGRTHTRIVFHPRGRTMDVHTLLRFGPDRLARGVSYRLVVEALAANGETAVVQFPFTAAP
jgi:hypothetical protein